MNSKIPLMIAAGVLLFSCLLSAMLSGKPDSFASDVELLLIGIGIVIGIPALLGFTLQRASIPTEKPKRKRDDRYAMIDHMVESLDDRELDYLREKLDQLERKR